MDDLFFIKTQNGLLPQSEQDNEAMKSWKIGDVIAGKFRKIRNPVYHRRFYAMLNFAYEYYEPSNGTMSKEEIDLAEKIFTMLEEHSGKKGIMLDIGRNFLKGEMTRRKQKIGTVSKSFDAFRKSVLIESGMFNYVVTPRGVIKEAVSISFAKMGEEKFKEVYKAVFNTVWNMVLSKSFDSEEQVQDAINKCLDFA